MFVLLALGLVTVHTVDGHAVTINPAQVTRMSEARRDIDGDRQLAKGVQCVIFFTDGSYLSTADSCDEIVNRWLRQKEN